MFISRRHGFGPTLQMLWGLVLTWVLIALTFIDFDTQLLPDRFTYLWLLSA